MHRKSTREITTRVSGRPTFRDAAPFTPPFQSRRCGHFLFLPRPMPRRSFSAPAPVVSTGQTRNRRAVSSFDFGWFITLTHRSFSFHSVSGFQKFTPCNVLEPFETIMYGPGKLLVVVKLCIKKLNGIASDISMDQRFCKGTGVKKEMKKDLAEHGFDPRTSGLWAQHASTAPLCYR